MKGGATSAHLHLQALVNVEGLKSVSPTLNFAQALHTVYYSLSCVLEVERLRNSNMRKSTTRSAWLLHGQMVYNVPERQFHIVPGKLTKESRKGRRNGNNSKHSPTSKCT